MFNFLSNTFSSLFDNLRSRGQITEGTIQETIEKIQDALLQADVPYELADQFIKEVKKEVLGKKSIGGVKPAEYLASVVHKQVKEFLGGNDAPNTFLDKVPATVMVMGLQGAGKTTSLAKMAYWSKNQQKAVMADKKIVLASTDFHRPAAIDQLEVLASKVGAAFYRAASNDPVQAAQEIYAYTKKEGFDILFLDTAGRLQIDNELLLQLREIDGLVKPRYKMLVLDAMTGQESLSIARAFDQGVGFSHAFISKMDSNARAGAVFSFRYALKKSILFVGTGEKIEDLEFFHPDRVAGRILGQGDLISLAEKADEKIKKADQQAAYKSFAKGTFTLQDFAQQMEMMNKLGSFSTLLKYLPGMGAQAVSPEALEKGEAEMKKMKAIIGSMTLKERLQPEILNGSRKKRVANGAGVGVAEVNSLLSRFEQSKQYVKLLSKFGKSNNFFK